VLPVDCFGELIHVYTGNDMPLVFPETSGWANRRPQQPIQDDYLVVLKDFAPIQILELFCNSILQMQPEIPIELQRKWININDNMSTKNCC